MIDATATDLDANPDTGTAPADSGPAPGQPEGEPDLKAVIDALAARVSDLEDELKQARDQTLRAYAEAENIRKRSERQMIDERQYAIEKFARDLLGVADNLGRALQSVDIAGRDALPDAARPLVDGIDLTHRELTQAMAKHGVKAIEATPGSIFDPNKHQAVAQIPSALASGTIAELFQPGFELNGRVLRAAMVAVSAGQPN